VFLPVAMVPGDMVALARLHPERDFVSHGIKRLAPQSRERAVSWGADGPASRNVLRNEGGPNYLPRLNDACKKYAPKRNDFVVKTSLSCRGNRIS
jgi:hypothetical protein